MAQYSFPILENDELLPCLEEMEIPLSAADLAKPTYEIVRPLFENVLTTLTGITREELNQPVFTAIDAFEFPELHDESVPCLNFFRQLGRLLSNTGVRDFNLRDVYKPETQRLRRHLSAIVNFAKFREEKLVAYAEMQARLEAALEERRLLEAEHLQRATELKRLQGERASEASQVAAIETESAELFAVNQQLNKQQATLNGEVRTLKQQSNALADSAAQAKFDLLNASQENERLAAQVVQSPEKAAKALAELAERVEGERGLVADAERRSRDLQARLDAIIKADREVAKCIGLMDEAEAEISRKKEASRAAKDLKGRIQAAQHEAEQLSATQQHLRRQQAALVERLQRLEHQASLKLEAAASAVEEQLREREAIEAENAAVDARLAENEAVIRSVAERCRELEAAHAAQLSAVGERYRALRRTVAEYNAALERAMREGEMAPEQLAAGVGALAIGGR